MQILIGCLIGVCFLSMGYVVWTKKAFHFLAGFQTLWIPINPKRLSKRIGMLLMVLGGIAILTAIFTIPFGEVVETISSVCAFMTILCIFIVIGLDKVGY